MTDEVTRDDIETLENELANLTAYIRTLKQRAAEVRVALILVKTLEGN